MTSEIVQAFFFILMAEMGDKTQMLAMAFATKYSLKKVLLGVLIGSSLNHGLAALLGVYLTNFIPISAMQLLAALAFICFGIWSLKIDEEEEEDENSFFIHPVITIASAFFIGEIGDKTQLTVITLASQAVYPVLVTLGAVLGMVVTSAIGVFVGSRLGKRIPEVGLKVLSSVIFIVFGLIGLKEAVPAQYMTIPNISIFLVGLGVVVLSMLNKIRKYEDLEATPYKKAASELYLNTIRIQEALQKVCEKSEECIQCKGSECTIQCLSQHLKEAQEKERFVVEEEWKLPLCSGRSCNTGTLKESLIETINTCMECPSHQTNCIGNQTRKTLEILYFGKSIPYRGNRKKYYAEIKKIDPQFFN